jgi:hypothetical protein
MKAINFSLLISVMVFGGGVVLAQIVWKYQSYSMSFPEFGV